MAGIGFDLQPLLDDFRSQCRASGGFDGVVTHELRKPPTNRFVLGAWWDNTRPIPQRSGLAATSVLITLMARIYMPLQGDPDQLDTELYRRVDLIMAAMHSGLTFTDDEHEIDVLGAFGDGVIARAGFLPMPDNTPVRIGDVFVPIIVNDAYTQVRS